jgi:hypothetical protein
MYEYGPRPHTPLSEVEVFVGDILGKAGAPSRNLRELSISMKERWEEELSFAVDCITKEGERNERTTLELSMACLWVGLNDPEKKVWDGGRMDELKLRSFKYVAAALCLKEYEVLGP